MEKFFRSWKLPYVKSEEDSLVLIGLRSGIVSIFQYSLLFAYGPDMLRKIFQNGTLFLPNFA